LELFNPWTSKPGISHFIKSSEMQSIKTLLRNVTVSAVLLLSMFHAGAQITLSTASGTGYTGTNSFGAVNSVITFVVENTTSNTVLLNSMSHWLNTDNNGTVPTLWYTTTSLSNAPNVATPIWTQIATGNPITVTTSGVNPIFSGLSFPIPAGATYRFAFQSSLGMGYSGSGSGAGVTPNVFSSSGLNLLVGNSQISGFNIGYAGGFPAPTNNPRFFTGSLTFIPAVACSGTPAPGNTLSSVAAACAGVNFTLSTQNTFPFTGITYQWQSAPSVSGPWTDISGATQAALSASQTSATFYRCNVTCAGGTGTSTPVQVAMNLPTNCYCSAGATQTTLEKISRVRYNQIDNSSTSTAGYENFLNISTPAYLGATSQITINLAGGFAADQSQVWIDFNQNGNFSDPGELVFTSANSAGPHIGTITIPATALQGNTRMRVRMHDTSLGPNNTPCGNSSWGQVEDYTVNIQVCVPVTFATQPSSTSVTCGGNTSFSVTANGSAPVYGWQFRVNASSPWQDLTNTGIYTGATTNTLTLTDVLASFSGYQYRALLSGACAALDYSQPATLTVNPPVTNVTPASASICNGAIQALSITNSVSAPTTGVWAASAGLPLAIPDNTPVGTTSTVSVSGIPAGSLVTNIAVRFSMTHTWAGDLVMNLRAPNGQVLNLVGLLNNGQGLNNTANFTNTIIDSTATTPLSGAPAPRTGRFRADRYAVSTAFNPIASTTGFWSSLLSTLNGNWTLGLSDLGPGDLGTLTAWEIQISYVAPVFAQGVWTSSPAAPNTMFTDAAATVPYTGTPATTIYVKPATNTSYSVQFTTPGGCTSSVATIPVTVSQPVVGLNVSPATRSVCVGGSTSFSATATSGGPLTYQWAVSTDGGTNYSNISGATSATLNLTGVTQAMSGNRYRVTATAGPCGAVVSTGVGTLTVNPLPVVTLASPMVKLVPGRTTVLTASSNPPAAANGYSWTLNGSGISGTGNSQTANIDRLGTYQVTVTDVNGCVNKSNSLTIFAEGSDRLWIYPNPTSGAFQVRLYHSGERAEKRVVTIYNTIGQVIESKEFVLVAGLPAYYQMNFDLGGGATAKGAYVVKVADQYSGRVVSGLVMVH
jgi:subtilisin-like proprotein convertase family protein